MTKYLLTTAIVCLPFSLPVQAATIASGDGAIIPALGEDGGQIEAGRTSTGTVTIDDGSIVTITSGSSDAEFIARPKIDVADIDAGGGTGTVTVTGAGTTVNLSGTNSGSKLEIATFSGNTGTLEVLDGATINLTDDGPINGDDNENVFVQIGEDEATGTLLMNNGTINATGHSVVGLLVGIAGNTDKGGTGLVDMTGSSMILNGLSTSTDSFIIVGDNELGDGTVTMNNSALQLNTPDQLSFFQIGRDGGSGSVALESSSMMSVGGESVLARIGSDDDNSAGTLTLNASTTSFFGSTDATIRVGDVAGSVGEINLQNGSTLSVIGSSGGIQIGSSSSTNVVGSGQVNIDTSSLLSSSLGVQIGSAFSGQNNQTGQVKLNNGTLQAPEVVVGTGGSLVGSGTVDAVKTVLSGGMIAPGLSPGVLEFTGDLEVGGGSFLFEIGGNTPSLYDSIFVAGILSATSMFDITFQFINGFSPAEDDVFEIFSAGSLEDSFLNFAEISSNIPFEIGSENGSIGIKFDPVAPVPLPAAGWLLIASVGGLFAFGRRQQQALK